MATENSNNPPTPSAAIFGVPGSIAVGEFDPSINTDPLRSVGAAIAQRSPSDQPTEEK